MHVALAKQGVSIGEIGIYLDRSFEIGNRRIHILLRHPVIGGDRSQIVVPCTEIVRPFSSRPLDLSQRDFGSDYRRDAGHDVVLQLEEIIHLAVVSLCPYMAV